MELVSQPKNCPFYGFAHMAGVFIEQQGNQCPLKDGFSPCEMEMKQQPVNWFRCRFSDISNQSDIEQLLEKGVIFPESLKPSGLTEWNGVSLKGWFHLVLQNVKE